MAAYYSLNSLPRPAPWLWHGDLHLKVDTSPRNHWGVQAGTCHPVNTLLSFGYTLASNEIASLLDGIGFDPYIGFFHKSKYGRPSLAADLLEEFRSPIVDRLTLKLINNRVLTENDFYFHKPSGSMYLKRTALKCYFTEYKKVANKEFTYPRTGEKTNFRRCFRIQG